jgi:hypothetical protein
MAGGVPFNLSVDGTDLLLANIGGSAESAFVVPDTIQLSADADGGGSQLSFEVEQRVTPSPGGTPTPWYASLSDNAVVEFVDGTVGTANGQSTFFGFVANIEARLNGGGQGTIARVDCLSATSILDRIMVWKGAGTLGGIQNATISTIRIARSTYDDVAIKAILDNYVIGRLGTGISQLFDPTLQTEITRTALLNPDAADGDIEIPLGNLRAALDTILELAQATDGKARRYYLDNKHRLVYGWGTAADAGLTYPNAPFKIITAGVDNPAGGTATASTLLVRDFSLSIDHDSVRKRAFILTADSNADDDTDPDPYVRLYTDVGFSARSGLVTDSLVGAPTVRGSDRTSKLDNAATAYFATRRAPVQSIRFSVRGAGTATGQTYGYSGGTAQAGTASYVYVDRWAPGQYVEIEAPGLGLDGIYRVEEVSMTFEPGSLIRKWDITCQRRPRGLASLYLIGRS